MCLRIPHPCAHAMAQELLNQADALCERGDQKEALSLYEKALQEGYKMKVGCKG